VACSDLSLLVLRLQIPVGSKKLFSHCTSKLIAASSSSSSSSSMDTTKSPSNKKMRADDGSALSSPAERKPDHQKDADIIAELRAKLQERDSNVSSQ